jgi:hypothetical protein
VFIVVFMVLFEDPCLLERRKVHWQQDIGLHVLNQTHYDTTEKKGGLEDKMMYGAG